MYCTLQEQKYSSEQRGIVEQLLPFSGWPPAQNITVYRMTPFGVLDMVNKDTGDVKGDTSFVLSRKTAGQWRVGGACRVVCPCRTFKAHSPVF